MARLPTSVVAGLCVVVLLGTPVADVLARHNDGGYSSSVTRKIRALDDDEVDSFAIPVLFGVTKAQLYPNFGDPRDGGARTHEGFDILAPKGTPIVSPTEAVVVRTGSGDSAGKYVYTANPGGETFRYMHLDEIARIRVGDVLEVGDIIGTVGDTGNAKGGPAHLHLEIREGSPKDPFPRIQEEFSLKEKIDFIERSFEEFEDTDDTAEFLVDTYRSEFTLALNQGFDLPEEIEDALADRGIVSAAALREQLETIIDSIPDVVEPTLGFESQGAGVSLLQFYLISRSVGPARNTLASAGATGYFGPATNAALVEYQVKEGLAPTGVYDAATRAHMRSQ